MEAPSEEKRKGGERNGVEGWGGGSDRTGNDWRRKINRLGRTKKLFGNRRGSVVPGTRKGDSVPL